MIYFVGAGPGAPDLITVRGEKLLRWADLILYAGSLVNPGLLADVKTNCEILDSSGMTLEQMIKKMTEAERDGKLTIRLHTGDPAIYGAIREQMDALDQEGIPYELVPGVSSLGGAAAALKVEYTPPGVSQTVIITRTAGRTPVPEREQIASLAAHGATMAIFLSAGLIQELVESLLAGGCPPDCPAAIVYKATWPEEKVVRTIVSELPKEAEREGISKTALILVGKFLEGEYERSRLYHPGFSHGCRKKDEDEI